jgi:sensor histidine kinase regulating citrate/malate metabolism
MMKLRISLQTRFMLYVIVLLCVLATLILFIIEKREIKAIFEEQKNMGLLTAKYIANLNSQPLIQWDEEGVEESIEEKIDEKLIYIAIYDKFRTPFAASRFIKDYEETYRFSRLGMEVNEDSVFSQRKRIVDKATGQILRILEIEIPIFVKGSQDRWGSIKIGLSLEETQKEIQQTRLILILIGGGGLLIGVL